MLTFSPPVEKLWQIYCRLPLQSSKDLQEQTRLRREVVRLKREMTAVSAQDEFSRWAKLRRQHDKALAEYDKKGESFFIEEVGEILSEDRGLTLPPPSRASSRRRRILARGLRHQGHGGAVDLHERPAVRPAVLAREDARLHLPARLVPLVRRVAARVPAVSLRRGQRQRLEHGVRHGHRPGVGRGRLRDPVHTAGQGWTDTDGGDPGEGGRPGSGRREEQMIERR